jgi:hypothetical protein
MWVLACSGGAEAIYVSIALGYAHARAAAVLLGISMSLGFLQRRWLPPILLLILLSIHPAWTVSAIHGDCGMLKQSASWVFTLISTTVLVWQLVLGVCDRLKKSRPAFG